MIKIITYQIKPYLLIGQAVEPFLKPGADWLRDVINQLMRHHRPQLVNAGIDTSIFHNHDEKTSHTMSPYPRIVYQNHNGLFLVSGISEGEAALSALSAFCQQPAAVGAHMMVHFSQYRIQETEIVHTEHRNLYQINHYLALDQKTHKQYVEATAVQKIQLLERTLKKHLAGDLFLYLGVDIGDPVVEILEVLPAEPRMNTYKNHHYLSFNLVFSLDVELPDYVALGNGKAFGYGVITRVTD